MLTASKILLIYSAVLFSPTTVCLAADAPPKGDLRGKESMAACEAHPPSFRPTRLFEEGKYGVFHLDGKKTSIVLPAELQWISKPWSDENAQMPYLVYLPEKDRLVMLVNCLQPIRAAFISSDDHGKTWSQRRWMAVDSSGQPTAAALGLTCLGQGKLIAFPEDLKTFWRSLDHGQTWKKTEQSDPGELYAWDPLLVLRDQGGRVERLVEACWRPTGIPWGSGEAPYSQAYLRFSRDEGQTWSSAVKVPQWLGVNEVSILVARNGDWIATCRTDYPARYAHLQLDHYGGLAVSISRDQGQTWSESKAVYEWGRHHPSMVLTSDGKIVMTYCVRLGYPDDAGGLPRFGVEAVVSADHGQTWDMERRYVLAVWTGNVPSSSPNAWFCSVQSTSTVRLPDGTLFTAFGTGFRNPVNASSCKMDIALVKWRLRE